MFCRITDRRPSDHSEYQTLLKRKGSFLQSKGTQYLSMFNNVGYSINTFLHCLTMFFQSFYTSSYQIPDQQRPEQVKNGKEDSSTWK